MSQVQILSARQISPTPDWDVGRSFVAQTVPIGTSMAFATGGLFFQERRVGMAFSERAYAHILVFQRFGFRRYLHRHLFYSTKYPPNESRRKAVRQKRTPSASRLSRRPSGEALWGISWNMIMGYEPTVKPCTRLPLADPSQGKPTGESVAGVHHRRTAYRV